MPHIGHIRMLAHVKNEYDALPRYKKRLYPVAVGAALEQFNINNPSVLEAFAVCHAMLNNTWFFQRWLFRHLGMHSYVAALMSILRLLKRVGLLTEDNAYTYFSSIIEIEDPCALLSVLDILRTKGLLTGDSAQDNFNIVLGYYNLSELEVVLKNFRDLGLLRRINGQTNFNALAEHPAPHVVSTTLEILYPLSLVGLVIRPNMHATQATFNLLIRHSDILFGENTAPIWVRILHCLNEDRFLEIIAIAIQHDGHIAEGQAAFEAYVNNFREPIPHIEERGLFNPNQSTHTASIHVSATESANRLFRRYGAGISGLALTRTLCELQAWLNSESSEHSLKLRAAKRCLERLIARDYSFIDPVSHVSTKQLLALVWIAIHDNAQRVCTLADAKILFIEGLYEAQREYNLSEMGVDDNHPIDIPSCPPGTFNKILEKGCGVHPDIMLNFITQTGAANKLPIVVNTAAMRYLNNLAKSLDGLEQLSQSIDAIQYVDNENTVEPIWSLIKDDVNAAMYDEFKCLYDNNELSVEFLALIEAGKDVALTRQNLLRLEHIILSSISSFHIATHPNGFFAANDDANSDNNHSECNSPLPTLSRLQQGFS